MLGVTGTPRLDRFKFKAHARSHLLMLAFEYYRLYLQQYNLWLPYAPALSSGFKGCYRISTNINGYTHSFTSIYILS